MYIKIITISKGNKIHLYTLNVAVDSIRGQSKEGRPAQVAVG